MNDTHTNGMERELLELAETWRDDAEIFLDHEDSISLAQQLRSDAEALETAHEKLKEGEFTGAEAAVYVARRANFGDYDLAHWLDEEMPITEEP